MEGCVRSTSNITSAYMPGFNNRCALLTSISTASERKRVLSEPEERLMLPVKTLPGRVLTLKEIADLPRAALFYSRSPAPILHFNFTNNRLYKPKILCLKVQWQVMVVIPGGNKGVIYTVILCYEHPYAIGAVQV